MPVNTLAVQAKATATAITGVLSISRAYLGLPPHRKLLGSHLKSEFVDPPRFRAADTNARRGAA